MSEEHLSDVLRKLRGQSTISSVISAEYEKTLKGIPEPRKKKKKTIAGSSYDIFLHKYEDLDNSISAFNTQDCVYFFREKSHEAGAKYVIANMQRDIGIFKKLQESFSVMEILLMIEFIFSGEQTYLDIRRVQPTVLASNWVNKIYQDSIDWSNDCYIDTKTPYTKKSTREWSSSDKTPDHKKVKVGEW